MDFYAVLEQVLELLRQRGRVTYRALKRQFALDDDYIEDLKAELIQGQRLAVDEGGTVLVWTGDRASVPSPSDEPAPAPRPAEEDTTALATSTPSPHGTSRTHASPALAGERRQVTMLFADIWS